MQKVFSNVDEVLADEDFLNWFYNNRDQQSRPQWLSADQQHLADEAVAILSAIQVSEKKPGIAEVNVALSALENNLNQSPARVIRMNQPHRRWWIAAAAILVAVAGIVFWKISSNHEVLSTSYGQLSQHTLPDGSEVMLNANSSVKLGSNWENGDREVWLNGEAFFHVKKTHASNRFIVHTPQMDVIVTGTQFNVTTRDEKSSVLLTEGSVIIRSSDGREIFMKPGDYVEIQTNKLEKKEGNEEAILAWKENRLYFNNADMQEAANIISAHYGVKIILADDTVAGKKLSGMMPNNNLDILLKALEATNDFRITRNENEIVIANP